MNVFSSVHITTLMMKLVMSSTLDTSPTSPSLTTTLHLTPPSSSWKDSTALTD